ncbi:tRNA lysidine(34) synthetase TilS [Cobetia sp. LC6]|uniref:tRNA lysidine(34) synthetase TilS n=1 Tax=Cobetia sp. LC6 TaxID=3050947 RepID=UPI0025532B3D|nr:tRNA lysidine(34) synthetase TilS [Cobetia sp. LC6]MDL2191604.1 tRNA lysidine(34) synthetase TilS [Cobetia sp. LC6]
MSLSPSLDSLYLFAQPLSEMAESRALVAVREALEASDARRTVWVALSGGLDSVMLARLAARAVKDCPRRLRLVHVHHGLQAANDDFEQLARRLASRLGLPLSVRHLALAETALKSRGLEAAAREGRLAALSACLVAGDSLWLAQHQDDQAETLLLNALRGSGGRGLAAMPSERALAMGEASPGRARLLRPLLGISRDEIQTLASQQGLQAGRDWCEDPSNVDQQFDRNYLRHSVVPLLQARWPQAVASLARSAQQLQEEQSLLDELAAELLTKVQVTGAERLAQRQGQGQGLDPGLNQGLDQGREQETQLSLTELAGLSESRQRLVLRHLCQSRGWPVPPRGRLMSLQRLIATPPDSVAEVQWGNAEYAVSVRAWRGQLWWQVSDTVIEQSVCHRQGDNGYARSGRQPGERPSCEWDSEARKAWRALGRGEQHVAFTSRQPGDVLRVAGRGRRDIKRLLQEADIPPWQREQLRVARMNDGTVAGLWHPSRGWWLLASLTSQ